MAIDAETADSISEYRLEFNGDFTAIEEQRDECNEDVRFISTPAAQWEGFLRESFGSNRPRFQLDLISQSIDRFNGEWLTNRATVNFKPEDGNNKKDAEILTGLYRKDERRKGGEFSVNNAVLEGIKGGVGAWKLTTEFVDEEDPDNEDQFIVFEPLYSACNMVVWDANAKRMDKADAKHCYVVHEVGVNKIKEQFPDIEQFSSFQQPNDRREYNWNSNKIHTIFIAERYEVKKETKTVFRYRNPLTFKERWVWKDQITEVMDDLADEGWEKISESKRTRKYVEKSIIDGAQFLEKPTRIAGKNIPIIPFYAYWTYTDGQEFFWGMVRKKKDAQRLNNMAISNIAETAATSPKQAPWLLPEQVKGHETNLSQMHLGKKNYQLLNPVDFKGTPVLGPVGTVTPPQIDPATIGIIEVSQRYINEQTGGVPQDVVDPDASGKAILAMQDRVDMNTVSIMKNIQAALRRCGDVYRDIAGEIYAHRRLVSVLSEQNEESKITLMDVAIDEETGRMIEMNDISKGTFDVVVDTGPAYASKRQQTVEEIRSVLGLVGEGSKYFSPLLAMLIENIDSVGLGDLKEFNRKEMLRLGIKQPVTEEDELFLQQLAEDSQGDQDPLAMEGEARLMEGQAALQNEQNDANKIQIDAFNAETNRQKVQILAAEAGVKIQNTQADTQGKSLDNVSKQQDIADKEMEGRIRSMSTEDLIAMLQ